MKSVAIIHWTHNPFEESNWVSRLRENITSSSDEEELETGLIQIPHQSFTRQSFFAWWKRYLTVYHSIAGSQQPGLMVRILAGLIIYMLLAIHCHKNHGEALSIRSVRELRLKIQNVLRISAMPIFANASLDLLPIRLTSKKIFTIGTRYTIRFYGN